MEIELKLSIFGLWRPKADKDLMNCPVMEVARMAGFVYACV
jgi:hypothetical protein